jgi:hypothetical protein
MKLIGKYQEFPNTEILLFKTPMNIIKAIIKNNKNIEIKVKEYIPRKYKIERPGQLEYNIPANKTLRHQIIITQEVPYTLKVKLYSVPIDAEIIRELNLEPIESAEKKERISKSLYTLSGKEWYEFDEE